ncbi:hypothetical protein ABT160_09120 [Streptomyces sp. NPDC001941]|uniref:hypothetical protein n=1 Tax=Streptomyces sp. NPDC001941 TaxID=3154659 RepID=UPI00332D5418
MNEHLTPQHPTAKHPAARHSSLWRRAPHGTRPRRYPAFAVLLAVTATTAVVVVSGCATGTASTGPTTAQGGTEQPVKTGKKVLWLGDSIAGAEAPPLEAALKAGGVEFKNAASDGGGTVVEGDKAQRSSDGIHSCQQGSAAFAAWFTEKLGKQLKFTPADAKSWATGAWTGDDRYGKLGCS